MPVQQQMQAPQPSPLQELLSTYNQANQLYMGGSYLSSLMGGASSSEAAAGASSGIGGAVGYSGLGSLMGGLGATALFFSLMQGGDPTIQDMLASDSQLMGWDRERMQAGAPPLSGILAQGVNTSDPKAFLDAIKPDIQASMRKGQPVTQGMVDTLRRQYQQMQEIQAPYESSAMRKNISFMQGKGPIDPLTSQAPSGGLQQVFMGTGQQPSFGVKPFVPTQSSSFSSPGSFFGTTGDPRFNF